MQQDESHEGMLRIGEVCRLTGVSESKLRLYDRENVLTPSVRDPKNGYRYYTAEDVEKLRQILVLRELGMGLEEIRRHLATSGFRQAVIAQIGVLEQQQVRNAQLTGFARAVKLTGLMPEEYASFRNMPTEEGIQAAVSVLDLDQARKANAGQMRFSSVADIEALTETLFALSLMRELDPHEAVAVELIAMFREELDRLKATTLYTFRNMGKCFAADGTFAEDIDKAFGAGTAAFIGKAIAVYCETVQEVPTKEEMFLLTE